MSTMSENMAIIVHKSNKKKKIINKKIKYSVRYDLFRLFVYFKYYIANYNNNNSFVLFHPYKSLHIIYYDYS